VTTLFSIKGTKTAAQRGILIDFGLVKKTYISNLRILNLAMKVNNYTAFSNPAFSLMHTFKNPEVFASGGFNRLKLSISVK